MKSLRQRLHAQLATDLPGKRRLSLINWLLVGLILFSLATYTFETERRFAGADTAFLRWFNFAILLVFGAEFALRLWTAGIEKRFAGRPGLILYIKDRWFLLAVDFLAFAPELIFLIFGLGSPGWLRSLRVFRLFKMARYFSGFSLVAASLRACYRELLVAFGLSVILWYLASVALYFAEQEAQPDWFGSIPRAMWWSVITLTTVGYGDVYPVSIAGRIAAGIVAVIGLGTVALPSGILAAAFLDQYRERRKRKDAERDGEDPLP